LPAFSIIYDVSSPSAICERTTCPSPRLHGFSAIAKPVHSITHSGAGPVRHPIKCAAEAISAVRRAFREALLVNQGIMEIAQFVAVKLVAQPADSTSSDRTEHQCGVVDGKVHASWFSDKIMAMVSHVPALIVDQESANFPLIRTMFGLILIVSMRIHAEQMHGLCGIKAYRRLNQGIASQHAPACAMTIRTMEWRTLLRNGFTKSSFVRKIRYAAFRAA
jgi:hypothetical protein